jgi:hypothetical protein
VVDTQSDGSGSRFVRRVVLTSVTHRGGVGPGQAIARRLPMPSPRAVSQSRDLHRHPSKLRPRQDSNLRTRLGRVLGDRRWRPARGRSVEPVGWVIPRPSRRAGVDGVGSQPCRAVTTISATLTHSLRRRYEAAHRPWPAWPVELTRSRGQPVVRHSCSEGHRLVVGRAEVADAEWRRRSGCARRRATQWDRGAGYRYDLAMSHRW